MTDPNPWFPYSYPSAYVSSFNRRALSQELLLETVQRSNAEVVRRIVGLQLFIFDAYGLRLGWGTGWRVQTTKPDGTALPGHALPGNSWHEGIPVASKTNAFAIDTVGCDDNGTPRHGDVWTLQELHCESYGLVSFRYLDDRPHLQAIEIPRARSWRNSLAQLPVYPLPRCAIPARYDLNHIDAANPLASAPPLVNNPNTGEDDMKFRAYYTLGAGPGIFAAYQSPGCVGVKVQMRDMESWTAHCRRLIDDGVQGLDVPDFGLVRTNDPVGFAALGPILGDTPAGLDTFGVPA